MRALLVIGLNTLSWLVLEEFFLFFVIASLPGLIIPLAEHSEEEGTGDPVLGRSSISDPMGLGMRRGCDLFLL